MSGLHTLAELEALPTLAVGQSCDLKIEEKDHGGMRRVWLSRCTVDDGEPYDNKVTIERIRDGRWESVVTYQALSS